MKKICYLLVFLVNPLWAKECTTQWEFTAKGFYVGSSVDTLQIDKGIIVTSNFTPNQALKMFGVDSVKRTIELDSSHTVIKRQETVGNKTIVWEKEKDTYKRVVNGVLEAQMAYNPAERIIDSTIFPYLSYLELFMSGKVKVFSSDPLYEAKITQSATRLDFNSAQSNGYVNLKDNYPVYFKFTTKGDTVEGRQTSAKCT